MRIAVSSAPFRQAFAAGDLTQLEWLERCVSALGADGVLAETEGFPRLDGEYVAQLRKVAIDLGLVPLGIDARALLDLRADPAVRQTTFALASAFGAALIRTVLPAPGPVPPATFVEMAGVAKDVSRSAKAANVTVVVAAEQGTLAETLADLKHAVKDVDSAWLRACPRVLDVGSPAPKERYPAFVATPGDDPAQIAARASRAWVILDAPASDRPWGVLADAIDALRREEGRDRSGRLTPG